MGRGYSYTTKEERVIKSVAELSTDDTVTIHYADGTIEAAVQSVVSKKKE